MWKLPLFAASLWIAASLHYEASAEGFLSAVRSDVRSSGPGGSEESSQNGDRCDGSHRHHHHDDYDDDDGFFSIVFCRFAFYGVTSPFWGPVALLDDSYDIDGYFGDYPYDGRSEGYMVFSPVYCDCGALLNDAAESPGHRPDCMWYRGSSKTFSGRFTAEWAEQPGDVSRIGGRLQLNTASRFGLDTQTDWLREPATGPIQDELWLGDCNVVFRFAQSARAQFYTGVGFNWLDDPIDTDFGFNFTYGADFFPVRPWVVSSSIDWGSLGSAEQFRFRTTAGLMLNRVEVFAGYEYLDIDRTQINTYVTGVGIWF
jgi:hypothetical protein